MRYLSIGLDQGSIIVEVDICQRCFYWQSHWWKRKLWQHPFSGKVHAASSYKDQRTECGVRIPTTTKVADKHIAVSVS